ncbi:MAG: hypothetical protein JO129_01885, partial [Candidatus Dependentiae bacterium]|nr:hypothetical protein [Candidatus Dependentiae bacterium]
MKKIFLLVCLFAISITGIIQASNSTPIATRVYGDQFTPEINQTQIIGTAGVINASFGSSGNININFVGTQSYANAIQVLSDGTFVVLLNDGTNAYVAKFSENGVLQPTYSSMTGQGFGINGVCTISNISTVPYNLSIAVDEQGRFLVTGTSSVSNHPVIKRVTAAGSIDSSFIFSDTSWHSAGLNVLALQNTGKIIAVGNNSSNGQIARYNFNGTLDTTFGVSGYAIFNGSNDQNAHAYPTVTAQLNTAYIDTNNNIYIPYANGSSSVSIIRLTSSGAVDTSWGTSGIVVLSYLTNPNSAQTWMGVDLNNNLVIATTDASSGNIYITSIAASNGGAASPAFTNTTITGNFNLYSLITTTDGTVGKILLTGNDTTTITFRVTRLNSNGGIDTTFNPSFGYNEFSVGASITSSQLYSASLSPNGTLFVCGDNINGSSVQTPYVFCLYNEPYATQIARFPADTAQGVPNLSFGTTTTEAFAGVVSPFNGLYGASLLQKPQAAIEITTGSTPAQGDILIGMNGYTNTSANSNMMLAWLTAAGVADVSVGSSANGLLTLSNGATSEYLLSLLQGQSGSVYVAGYSAAGAILRAYSPSGTSGWTTNTASWAISSSDATTAGYQGIGVGSQAFVSSQRILLFVAESGTVGHISGYTTVGSLDTSFNSTGSVPGKILSTDFGLHMGPCYGSLVNNYNEIFAAYKDSSTNQITVAAFNSSGSGLIPEFGTSGIATGLFGGTTSIAANNIRTCFINVDNNIIIAAINGAGTSLLFTCLDGITGQVVSSFGISGILTVPITGATSLQLQEITGVSNGQVIATFWDNAYPTADDTMYIVRINGLGASAGTLDSTFNAQGAQPGILPIKIGDKVTDYYARALTSAIVQSTVGATQGNIIVAGYESILSTDSTPMVMSVYGAPGTTEVPYYPITESIVPGTLDVAYDLNSLLGLIGSGNAIFIYPAGSPYAGTMLVGIDNGTTSKVARIYISDITLDTTFGTGGVYTTSSLSGINNITIDKNNNVLISGVTDISPTVWAQQLSPNGASPVSFTIPSNITAIYGIYQQESGRYIIAASGTQNNPVSATNIGILLAFQDKLVSPATAFVVDPTFNPLGTGAVTAGQCSVGATAGLYAIAINNNAAHNPDTIAVAFVVSGTVKLGVFTADGSGYSNTTFNTGSGGAPITTNISADGSIVTQLNIDASGNMIVAASYNNGGTHQVQVQRYSPAGVKDATFNGNTGITTISNLGTSHVTLTDILATTTNQTILVGYNIAGGNGPLFAARLDSTGALDATWNPNASGTDTPGVLTYSADSATAINYAATTIDGLLVSIGSTSGRTTGDPIITIVYGDLYVTQVSQNPLEYPAGSLDLTIPNGNSGSLPLATLPTGGSVSGVPARMYIYNSTVNSSPNGAMLIASTDSTHVYVTQLNSDLSLNSNFGTSGVISFTPNSILSPTSVTVTDMYVANGTNDTTQPIYVSGYTTTSGVNTAFGAQIASNGSGSPTYVSPVSALTVAGQIRQSTNSRVFMSGFNGTNGAIVAYNSTMTALDTSFG